MSGDLRRRADREGSDGEWAGKFIGVSFMSSVLRERCRNIEQVRWGLYR